MNPIEELAERPVPTFDVAFPHNPEWDPIFDHQVERIQGDIRQARAAKKLIIYLSCPISGRGGGHQATNTDIARFMASRIVAKFGDRFWVLNPTLYQHQSSEGDKLLDHQAKKVKKGRPKQPPSGGDYMRMWTKALVGAGEGLNRDGQLGNVDAFYFAGPRDVHEFFLDGGAGGISAGIENHFARKFITEREAYSEVFEKNKVDAFIDFYALKASAAFSKGSHDEWNIFVLLNRERMKTGDVGVLIPGYFDGLQIDPASAAQLVTSGYAGEAK
jgi:hypothetical protein